MGLPARLEGHRFQNVSGACAGTIGFCVDYESGVIRAYGEGFWSVEQAGAYREKWIVAVRKIHGLGKSARILIDVRKAMIQAAEVPATLLRDIGDLYRPDDRIAMLVVNKLLKMQIQRVAGSDIRRYFSTPEAAETWLFGA